MSTDRRVDRHGRRRFAAEHAGPALAIRTRAAPGRALARARGGVPTRHPWSVSCELLLPEMFRRS